MRKRKEEAEAGLHAIIKKQVTKNKAIWLCDSMHINFATTELNNETGNVSKQGKLYSSKESKQEELHICRKYTSPTFSETLSEHWELCEQRISSMLGPFVYIWKIWFLKLIFCLHLQCTCTGIFQTSMS